MKLPELGENIEGGDVLRVMVKAGRRDQERPGRSSSSKPTKPRSKCRHRPPVSSRKSKSSRARRSRSARRSLSSMRRGRGQRQTATAVRKREAKPARTQPERRTRSSREGGDRRRPEQPTKAEAPKPETPRRKADVVEMKPSRTQAAAEQKRRSRPRLRYLRRLSSAVDPGSIPAAPSARRLARELGSNIAEIQGIRSCGPHLDGRRHGVRAAVVVRRRRRLVRPPFPQSPCQTSASGVRSSASR